MSEQIYSKSLPSDQQGEHVAWIGATNNDPGVATVCVAVAEIGEDGAAYVIDRYESSSKVHIVAHSKGFNRATTNSNYYLYSGRTRTCK